MVVPSQLDAQPKVNDLKGRVRGGVQHQEVLRLQVPMADILGVDVRQSPHHLLEVVPGHRLREVHVLDDPVE